MFKPHFDALYKLSEERRKRAISSTNFCRGKKSGPFFEIRIQQRGAGWSVFDSDAWLPHRDVYYNFDPDKIKDSLGTILRRSDPFELKWIIRVILKDLKLGMSRDLLLDAFHRDARRLYGVTARLSTVGAAD